MNSIPPSGLSGSFTPLTRSQSQSSAQGTPPIAHTSTLTVSSGTPPLTGLSLPQHMPPPPSSFAPVSSHTAQHEATSTVSAMSMDSMPLHLSPPMMSSGDFAPSSASSRVSRSSRSERQEEKKTPYSSSVPRGQRSASRSSSSVEPSPSQQRALQAAQTKTNVSQMIGKLAEDGSNELSSGDVCHSDAACWNWALYGGTRVASRDNPDPREMMPLLDNTDKNCKAYLKQFVTMGGLQVSSANTGLKARAYFENEGDHVFLRHIELDIHRPQGDLTITKGPSGPLVASRGQEDPENEDSAVHGTTPVSVNIKWESLLPDHRAAIANLLGKDVQLV